MSIYTYLYDNCVNSILVPVYVYYGNSNKRYAIGVIDTGCSHTVITEELAKELGLKQFSTASFISVDDKAECKTYIIKLSIDTFINCGTIEVGTFKKLDRYEDVLIGMDIIGKCDFALSCFNGKTLLSIEYPSKRNIDFNEC